MQCTREIQDTVDKKRAAEIKEEMVNSKTSRETDILDQDY